MSRRTKLGLNISDRVCQNTPSYVAILMECGNKTIKCRKTKTHYSVSDSLLLNRNLFRLERFTCFIFFYLVVRCNFKATVPTSKAYFDILGLKLAGRKSHLKKLEYPHVFFSFAFAFYSISSVPLYHFGIAFIYCLTLYYLFPLSNRIVFPFP